MMESVREEGIIVNEISNVINYSKDKSTDKEITIDEMGR